MNELMKTAMVLAGGGAKGAYQIGAWKALEEFNIHFDVLAGTSIGAINSFLMATKDVDFATKLWLNIGEAFSSTFSAGMSKMPSTSSAMIDEVFKEPKTALRFVNVKGMMDNDILMNAIKDILKDSKVEKNVYVGAVEMKDEPEVRYFNLKDKDPDFVAKAIMSSASIPLISSAVELEGSHYFDGGLIENVPLKPLLDEDCDMIISTLLKSKDLDHLKVYTRKPILSLMPSMPLGNFASGTMNFSRDAIHQRMELGYEDTYKTFNVLKKLI